MNTDVIRRAIVVLVAITLSIVFLLPTALREQLGNNWITKPIALGLDLSGGVHLVYEVQTSEAVKSRMLATANAIRSDLRNEKIAVTKATVNDKGQVEITLLSDRLKEDAKKKIEAAYRDLISAGEGDDGGRVKLIYGVGESQAERIKADSVVQAIERLRDRVDQFGVAEPLVQRVGAERILLQMPGVSDIESVKRIVGSVAKLEFRLVPNAESRATAITLKDREGGEVKVEDQVLMTGDAVADAQVFIPEGRPEVSLKLTSDGGKIFRKLTSENVGRQLAIVLDNTVYSSPVIRETIGGGQASISGHFTAKEAKELKTVLKSGALPAPMKVLEERTVGPTLGKESIVKSVTAMCIGFAAIALFMMVYYKKSGVVAVGTLVLNLLFTLAILSMFGATLTLPGMAGLALTIGMAVDSSVIIYERIRDEIRTGAGRDAAVAQGFDHAFNAIFDANISSLITGLILYYFGTGPVRGFAVTLSIGVITTLFCAIFVARVMFDWFGLRRGEQLSI
jgi:preprotein translocase subunit SecD